MRRSPVHALTTGLLVFAVACTGGSRDHASGTTPTTRRPGLRGGTPRAAQPQTRADGHGGTYAVPLAIPSDCSKDVTATLQSWIDGTPDNITLSLRADRCYRIEGTIEIARRRDLVLDGNGSTLRAKTAGTGTRLQIRSRSQVSIMQSRNITVRNLIVRGANPHAGVGADAYQPAMEAQHAFSLHADTGVTLDRVQAYDVYGDFVYIGGAVGSPSRHVTVTHSEFARSGRQGISMTNAEDVRIASNQIGFVSRSLFDLEPNLRADEVRHVVIEGNASGPVHNYWFADKGSGINISDITVMRNVMRAPSGGLVIVHGPKFGKRGPFSFVANELVTSGTVTDAHATGALLFAYASRVTVRGNRIAVAPAQRLAAVEIRTSANVRIVDNQLAGVVQPVVVDSASTNVDATHAVG